MATPVKSPPRSPETAIIPRLYNILVDVLSRPVQVAELLLSDGIITSKTAETISSDEDVGHKRTLLDAVQDVVVHSPHPEETISRLFIAMKKTGGGIDLTRVMRGFAEGE